MMASLLLLRHGQIKANREGHWHGSTDSPLTRRGRLQARRTAHHLADNNKRLIAIYSSPLRRCMDTARAVADCCKLATVVVDELCEYGIGEWEGMPFQTLSEEFDFVNRATNDPAFTPPGGESLAGVAARIVNSLRQIHRQHHAQEQEQILIVSHGAAMAVALGVLLDSNPARWTNYQFANCSLTELVLSPSPYVNFFNSTQHL